MRISFGSQVQDHGFPHHRLERQLLDRRLVAKKMMRRVDVRAGVHRHLDDVGDKAFFLPLDDRFQFEIFFIGREGRRVAFFYGHAEIDDTHVHISSQIGIRSCIPLGWRKVNAAMDGADGARRRSMRRVPASKSVLKNLLTLLREKRRRRIGQLIFDLGARGRERRMTAGDGSPVLDALRRFLS